MNALVEDLRLLNEHLHTTLSPARRHYVLVVVDEGSSLVEFGSNSTPDIVRRLAAATIGIIDRDRESIEQRFAARSEARST